MAPSRRGQTAGRLFQPPTGLGSRVPSVAWARTTAQAEAAAAAVSVAAREGAADREPWLLAGRCRTSRAPTTAPTGAPRPPLSTWDATAPRGTTHHRMQVSTRSCSSLIPSQTALPFFRGNAAARDDSTRASLYPKCNTRLAISNRHSPSCLGCMHIYRRRWGPPFDVHCSL